MQRLLTAIRRADFVGSAIIEALKPFEARVKTLTMKKAKNSAGAPRLMNRWAARPTLPGPLPVGNEALELVSEIH